jgi:UDP-N-acetylmuramoyl-tripeptide--D-alanyl-D-alanine ligase
MGSWSREEILMATGGAALELGGTDLFGEIVTHSRQVTAGSVFVALKGERFDGHAFLKEALERGAGCLVVQKVARGLRLQEATVIRVHDTLKALGDLAQYRRRKLDPAVLAITGSNGKTTTKEMVAAILERGTLGGKSLRGRVLKTEGNLNNLVGLPLTLLRLGEKQRVAVVELGTSHPGEIGRLTEIADPDAALITSVAPAHLTGLGSLAGVAREKGELFRRMNCEGTAVVNLDDLWVARFGKAFKGKKVTYGKNGQVTGKEWRSLGVRGAEFTLRVDNQNQRIRLRLCGRHNLWNAVGAAALAHSLGVGLAAIEKGLRAVKPFSMRMELEQWRGLRIINDAYNANPASMEAALRTLAEMPGRGNRVAVLGDMLELGRENARCHLDLGRAAARYRLHRLFLLGPQARRVKRGAVAAGMDGDLVVIGRDHQEIAARLKGQVKKEDWLLFKGSRGMQMEKVLAAFKRLGE